MPNSYVEYTTAGTGTNGLGQATFSYSGMDVLSADHVFCKIQSYDGSSISWAEASVASRNATAKTITLNSVPSGTATKVRVYRNTVSTPLIDFVDGARLTESDLDTAYKQGLLATQEVKEDAAVNGNTGVTNLSLTGLTSVQNLTATGNIIATNRPRFQLGMNNGTDTTGGTSDGNENLITFTNVITDIGNNVTSGNTFTAPIAGLYGFDATITTDYNSDKTNMLISLNVSGGQNYSVWNSTHEGYLMSSHISKNIYLTAGQTVKVFVALFDQNATSNSWDFETDTEKTNFSGYLIG